MQWLFRTFLDIFSYSFRETDIPLKFHHFILIDLNNTYLLKKTFFSAPKCDAILLLRIPLSDDDRLSMIVMSRHTIGTRWERQAVRTIDAYVFNKVRKKGETNGPSPSCVCTF